MKKNRILIILITILVLVNVAAAPSLFAEDLVRFTIINESNQSVYIYLDSENGENYYFNSNAGETKIYTPERGMYDYQMTTCGTTTTGTIDVTKHNTNFVVPPCGYKNSAAGNTNYTFNTAEEVKLVAIDLINESSDDFIVSLYGPSHFVFSLDPGKSKAVTIPKGTYSYTLYICGGVKTGFVSAYWGQDFTFTCKGINK